MSYTTFQASALVGSLYDSSLVIYFGQLFLKNLNYKLWIYEAA